MKKMITLLAAATLIASPFAFAETEAPSNANDVLQSIPSHQDTEAEQAQPMTIADSDASAVAPAMESSAPVKKAKHAKRHKQACSAHCKKRHAVKHASKHKKHKAAATAVQADQTVAPAATVTQ